MQFKRVVVTGIGTINPLGNNIQEYFDNLDEGKSGASLITRFDTATPAPPTPEPAQPAKTGNP